MGTDLDTPAFVAARDRLARRFGDAVTDRWWLGLSEALTSREADWGLDLGQPVGHGETAVVLPCVRVAGGDKAFLKLTPDPALSVVESRALDHWAMTGRVPRILERAPEFGALLLEALPTDLPLRITGGDPSLDAIASLVSALHEVPAPQGEYPPLSERVDFVFDVWESRVARDAALVEAVGPHRLAAGRRLAHHLMADVAVSRLLHGDLHSGNVFDVGGDVGLMTLDPRPCFGDPGFDLIDWILWRTDDPAEWRHRSDGLAALVGIDAGRTWAWCEAFAALLAALELARGAAPSRVAALRSIAPAS